MGALRGRRPREATTSRDSSCSATSRQSPRRPTSSLGLVGKAITFDTGGISLKPSLQHGGHEGRHGRRRRGDRGDRRDRRARPARAGADRGRRRCREHARRRRVPARRHPDRGERQDDRGHEHRRRGPARARRRALVRAPRTARRTCSTSPRSPARWRWRSATSTRASSRTTRPGRAEIVAAGEASGDHAWRLPAAPALPPLRRLRVRRPEELLRPAPGGARRSPPSSSRSSPAKGRGRTWTSPGPAFLERSRGDYLTQRGGTGYGVRLIVELASRLARELRPRARARARAHDGARVRRASGSRQSPRSSTASSRFPYELVAELAELGLMGMTIPEEYGGGGRGHALVRDRGRGADADRLVGRDHGRRAPLARDAADLLFGNEEQRRRVAAGPRRRARGSPRSG